MLAAATCIWCSRRKIRTATGTGLVCPHCDGPCKRHWEIPPPSMRVDLGQQQLGEGEGNGDADPEALQ